MSQNKEATQFLSRIATLPKGSVSLDDVLQPSLDDEAELRKLFATDKGSPRLKDIHVGLVDLFAAPPDIRTTRARVVTDDTDRDVQYVMPLPDALRRKEGSPAMVESLEAFKKNWSVFTENSLSQLSDWSNVVASGGSIQACLIPLPKDATASKRATRKYYHEKAFPSSDVDLFLYGLTTQEVGFSFLGATLFLPTPFLEGGAQDNCHLRSGSRLRSLGCHLRSNQAHGFDPLWVVYGSPRKLYSRNFLSTIPLSQRSDCPSPLQFSC
jgi:hypothetical protein